MMRVLEGVDVNELPDLSVSEEFSESSLAGRSKERDTESSTEEDAGEGEDPEEPIRS
jgi:hypothetical protein